MVTGLIQLAKQENFSKQSACNRQLRVRSTVASQCNRAADKSALNWPPWPNCSTPKRANASMTGTILVIMALKTSTLSSWNNLTICTLVVLKWVPTNLASSWRLEAKVFRTLAVGSEAKPACGRANQMASSKSGPQPEDF